MQSRRVWAAEVFASWWRADRTCSAVEITWNSWCITVLDIVGLTLSLRVAAARTVTEGKGPGTQECSRR
ncbi:hypothetical protein Z951_23645 [Streptomyces sp. PRh5]|uniref:hypothetical protein n=1 Tax=Streptomyces sp. PRh5 TaxID=1158056 RepID=UPI0004493D13|nr:hypothetical protein [Streptomyces sp. PRh5]EXU65821.1 hypothetical protein Z951_23645 [Streptomyces sp. PRh5]